MASFLRVEDPNGTAAGLLIPLLADIDRRRGRARLAVAGGSAVAVLGAVRQGLQGGVWSRLLLTWVDERCVAWADPQSNRGAAYRDGQLDSLDPPALELPLYLDGETPPEACARVAAALRQEFQGGLDVLLLGMGEDGHIASLFPGRPFERIGGPPVFAVPDSPKPPARRITLALSMLATAERAVLVAAGPGKRAALDRLAQGDPELPASALGDLTVIS
ncbi:MAG: 6-phosphogluconolactonase [Holophaga sp.]|nr:6-phosphogluconolactonase [Holophaga sp.]